MFLDVLMWYSRVFQVFLTKLQRLFEPILIWLIITIWQFTLYFLRMERLNSLKQITFFQKTRLINFFSYLNISWNKILRFCTFTIDYSNRGSNGLWLWFCKTQRPLFCKIWNLFKDLAEKMARSKTRKSQKFFSNIGCRVKSKTRK